MFGGKYRVINAYSWCINGKYAYKKIDKSVIVHSISGVPIEIRQYFDVENLKLGERKNIVLEYNSVKYSAYIEMQKNLKRTRLIWENDLQKQLLLKISEKSIGRASLVFEYISENYYKLSIDLLNTDDEIKLIEVEDEQFVEEEVLNQLLGVTTNDLFNAIEETEKLTYIKARIGHSKLKEILVKKDGCCKICGLSDERFLIASHIKPWSKSTNQERLDLNNVFLLCPHHDSAFDKGYITFDQDGMILISSELTLETRLLLNLNAEKKIELTEKQKEYMRWHKENIFHI